MRIAFLSPEYVTRTNCDGGLANYLKKTAQALVKMRCDVWVFVASKRDAVWSDDGVTVCEIRCDHYLINALSKISMVCRVEPLLVQIFACRILAQKFWEVHSMSPFDVIQASSYTAPGFALLQNGKVPVVCRVSSFTPCLRTAFGRKKKLSDYVSDWMELRQVRDADACFAPSHLLAKMYVQAECCRPIVLRTPVDMNINGLDSSFFHKNRPVGRYLLFFGTLSRVKGVDLLVQILPKIFEKHSDLSMVFIGRDDGLPDGTKVFAHIKANIIEYADRIHYYQALNKAKLYPFIEHAEAVLMPSRIDNYPNACLEAQMFGIPVVGTYDSSLDEMIDDGITGFLARNGDAENIIEGINRCLCQSGEEKKQMRQRIQSHIQLIKHEDRIGQLLTFYEVAVKKFMVKHGQQ